MTAMSILGLASGSIAGKKVTQGAPLKFFIFREDCFNKFISYDFSDMECVKFTISKGIGFAIVAGSSILKLPQIIKILSGKSVAGLAAISYYIEVCIYN